jgi:hypothetical protein
MPMPLLMSGIDSAILSNAQLSSQIGTAVAVKAKNVAEQQGQAVLSLLQAAVDVQKQSVGGSPAHLGRTLDVRG